MNQNRNGTAAAGPLSRPHACTDLAHIRAVADFLPQLVWSCRPDGHCDYLSRRWVEYTGVPEAEHHGSGWLGGVLRADLDRTRAAWRAFVAGTAEYDVDYRLRRHDGAYQWFKTRGTLVRDDAGVPVRVFGTTTDIDGQKRAEEGLRDSQQRLQLAQQVTRVGTFDWNIAENTNHWSPEILALYGLAPEEFEGSYEAWLRRLHPEDAAGADAEIRRSLETGQYDKDFRVVWPDGSVRWLHSRARVLYDDAGRPARMLGINADVTDRHRAEERLREAEERAVFVRKASGVGFWYCDLPFDVLEWDELVKVHFHLPPDARVTIDTFYERIHPDDREPTRSAIARSIVERSGYDVHYRTVHPTTGEEKVVRAIGRTFYGGDGSPRRFDGVTLDVTERRRAEGVLRDSEQRFRDMADTAPVALWLTDPDGRCTFLSREWYEFTGQTEGEALGLGWTTATHPDDQEAAGDTFMAANAARTTFRTEYRLRTRDGSYRWAMDIGRARFSPDGGYLGMVGAVFDLEDRKQAENALRDADRKKDDFIALLAHELRNPLAPIRNGLQIVRLADDRAVRDRAQAMMDRQLTHMVRLIDDLLDVSRISRNKMDLRRERVALADVVGSAVEASQPAIDAAGHELFVSLPTQPVHLDADLTRLAQVISNLLTNSARYTERGGKIWLSAERREAAVAVTVTDTGIGIPAASLPTIFDMFSQVDRSIERTTGGLGIGLALVKGLTEMHGGSVAARSDGQGKGSTFVVTLPALPDAAQGHGPARPTLTKLRPRRILVVDDNRDGAESLSMMLELAGHEVVIAQDGVDALARAERFRPEVILMDVGMPRMNGLEATRLIRQKAWGKSTTVIALTGWGQETDREQSRAAGCDGHLVKPVAIDDLHRMLGE